MGCERKKLRIPNVEGDHADSVVQLLGVLLSFYPFKRPEASWSAAEKSVLAEFDFITTGNDRLNAMTLEFLLQFEVLPKLYGERGPVVCYDDETLGHIAWISDLNYWKCEIALGLERYVELQLEAVQTNHSAPRSEEDVRWPDLALIMRGREIDAKILEKDAIWRSAASSRLLELYNTNWNDGPAIDSVSFEKRLSLESVTLCLDGTTRVQLAQEGLFTDHGVFILLNSAGEVIDANIEG